MGENLKSLITTLFSFTKGKRQREVPFISEPRLARIDTSTGRYLILEQLEVPDRPSQGSKEISTCSCFPFRIAAQPYEGWQFKFVKCPGKRKREAVRTANFDVSYLPVRMDIQMPACPTKLCEARGNGGVTEPPRAD